MKKEAPAERRLRGRGFPLREMDQGIHPESDKAAQRNWFRPFRGPFLLEGRRMAKCKLEDCQNPITGRQIYCTDRCRLVTHAYGLYAVSLVRLGVVIAS